MIAHAVRDASPDDLRQLIDVLRRKSPARLAVLLATVADGKVHLAAGLTPDLIALGLHAGNWLKEVAPVVGGGGGGRPDLAQAGGKNPDKVPAALERGAGIPPRQARRLTKVRWTMSVGVTPLDRSGLTEVWWLRLQSGLTSFSQKGA